MLNNNKLKISLLERNIQKTNYRVQQYTIEMHVPTMALLSLLRHSWQTDNNVSLFLRLAGVTLARVGCE